MIETRGFDRGKLFTWSFPFMPNAASNVPHIGHLFHLAHLRIHYVFARHFYHTRSWPVDIQWNVYFDCNPSQELVNAYLAMLDWLGWPPNRIDCRDMWLMLSEGPVHAVDSRSNEFVGIISRLPWEATCGSADPDRTLHKILYFNQTGVYWIVRGFDCVNMVQLERAAVRHLPFRVPSVFYHALLADADGTKIDCNLAGDKHKPYFLGDLIGKVSPDAVMKAVMKSLGFNKTTASYCLSPAEGLVVRHIGQLYPFGGWWRWPDVGALESWISPGEILRVPWNWRDLIEESA